MLKFEDKGMLLLVLSSDKIKFPTTRVQITLEEEFSTAGWKQVCNNLKANFGVLLIPYIW